MNGNKVLLHACCAICSGYPIVHLRTLGYEPIVYFFNPNIYPAGEHQKRLESEKKLCKLLKCELIIEDYKPEIYNESLIGFEDYKEGSERCTKCFELRLKKTAIKAKKLCIKNYTTSISISPHKNFKLIEKIGKSYFKEYGINFVDVDFKKKDGFLKTNKISKEFELYRQNYCGCEMSMQRLIENTSEISSSS